LSPHFLTVQGSGPCGRCHCPPETIVHETCRCGGDLHLPDPTLTLLSTVWFSSTILSSRSLIAATFSAARSYGPEQMQGFNHTPAHPTQHMAIIRVHPQCVPMHCEQTVRPQPVATQATCWEPRGAIFNPPQSCTDTWTVIPILYFSLVARQQTPELELNSDLDPSVRGSEK
jgi:hypothetical protein